MNPIEKAPEPPVSPHRLTQFCKCGRKADVGRSVDHPNGFWGEWICRECCRLQGGEAPLN